MVPTYPRGICGAFHRAGGCDEKRLSHAEHAEISIF